jgi:2-methylcitrate dehydratase PrpD
VTGTGSAFAAAAAASGVLGASEEETANAVALVATQTAA